jgi:hypothetical protein
MAVGKLHDHIIFFDFAAFTQFIGKQRIKIYIASELTEYPPQTLKSAWIAQLYF